MEHKRQKQIDLINQLIAKSEQKDRAEVNFINDCIGLKINNIGQSWITFHLKNLKELIIDKD
jgi:hypothetical protein